VEFRPIISALSRNKTSSVLVIVQIAVTLAIVVNSMFIVKQRIDKTNRPTGIDVDNIIVAELRGVDDDYDAVAGIRRDLDAIRSMSGVRSATITNYVPLAGSGSRTGLRTVADETAASVNANTFIMPEKGLASLGTSLVEGRNFFAEEIEYYIPGKTEWATPAGILVTKALADKLYPDGDALGKPVYWTSLEPSTIIGIIGHMQGSWVDWDGVAQVVIQPGFPAYKSNRYIIRTQPGEVDALLPLVEEKLAELDSNRVIKYVRSHRDIVDESYQVDMLMVRILSTVIVILVGLTTLVILGLVSYLVVQRTRQIGTRRALGATRIDILRYFLTENWIITTAGALLGSLLTVAISYAMETSFELPRLDMRYLLVSILVLWCISQFAAWFPARRAATVSPAIATRSV
jgi:putative ABC transport system permease protein